LANLCSWIAGIDICYQSSNQSGRSGLLKQTKQLCEVFVCLFVAGAASCYFPIELQGEYAMQSTSATPGGQVQYSQVNITADAILPIWGHCHRRLGNSVILTDR
jgi:hypothetical protein